MTQVIAHTTLPWQWWGRVHYGAARERLEAQRIKIWSGEDAPALFLCEHEPVVTLGRSSCDGDVLDPAVLAADGVALCQSNRGGRATYHGPGQLMVYPVVRLKRGIVVYLQALADALAELCTGLGVDGAAFRRDPAGLWKGGKKLAACGIHVSRGVAIHGFALNIATPQTMWRGISPCGLGPEAVTSVADVRGSVPAESMEAIAGLAAPLIQRHLLGAAV